MKFKVTIESSYEVPDAGLMLAYGSVDPKKCIEIDSQQDPVEILASCDDETVTMKIEVI